MHPSSNHGEDRRSRTPRQLQLTPEQQWDYIDQRWSALPDDVTKVQVGEFVVDRSQLHLFGSAALTCMSGQRSLELTNLSTGEVRAARMRCKGKRCLCCAPSEYQKLRTNLAGAFRHWGTQDAVVTVFTLNKRRDLWNAGLTDRQSYELLYKKFEAVHQWISRNYGVTAHFALVERHLTGTKDGGSAHLNVVWISKEFADAVRVTPKTGDRKVDMFPLWFQRVAKRCGWGRTSVEAMRDGGEGALAAYLAKIHEAQTTPMSGELTKKSQRAALAAPLHTKLVRPSRNFFPKKAATPKEWTGEVKKYSYEQALEVAAYRASLEALDAELEAEHQSEGQTDEVSSEAGDAEQLPVDRQLSWKEALLAFGGALKPTLPRIAAEPSKAVKEVCVHSPSVAGASWSRKKMLQRGRSQVPIGEQTVH